MENGYILIADLLGFSKIIENSRDYEQNGKVGTWLSLVDEATDYSKLSRKPQLISDTVFASTSPDDKTGLKKLVVFTRYLLENGIKNSLLVRGAIAHGPFEWGKLTYGKSVIDAHKLEENQDWIGVSCAPGMPIHDSLWGPQGLVCYPAPLKRGRVELFPVVVWNVPDSIELQRSSTTFPLTKPNEEMEWPWLRRIRNTIRFRAYLHSLTPENIDSWKKFTLQNAF